MNLKIFKSGVFLSFFALTFSIQLYAPVKTVAKKSVPLAQPQSQAVKDSSLNKIKQGAAKEVLVARKYSASPSAATTAYTAKKYVPGSIEKYRKPLSTVKSSGL